MSLKGKIAILCGILVGAAGVLWMTTTHKGSLITYTYSQFLNQVHSGQVASVVVLGSNSGAIEATCRLKDGKTERTVLPSDYKDALLAMQDKLVNIEIRAPSSEHLQMLLKATPFLVLGGVWIVLLICRFPNRLKQTLG